MNKINKIWKLIGIFLLVFQLILYMFGYFKLPSSSENFPVVYLQTGYIIGFNLYAILGAFIIFRLYKLKKNHKNKNIIN